MLGATHTAVLVVLATRDSRLALIAVLSGLYAIAAATNARALRRGWETRSWIGLAVWVATIIGVVVAVGGAFGPGPMFWRISAAAIVCWTVAVAWLGRRVAAERRVVAIDRTSHGTVGTLQGTDAPALLERSVDRLLAPHEPRSMDRPRRRAIQHER